MYSFYRLKLPDDEWGPRPPRRLVTAALLTYRYTREGVFRESEKGNHYEEYYALFCLQ